MKRYDPVQQYDPSSGCPLPSIEECADGDYVKFEDAEAELAQLRESKEALHTVVEYWKGRWNRQTSERDALRTRAETTEAAIESGQRNCDEVYNALRVEREEALAEARTALADNVALRDALEKELAENKKLKLGAVLFDFEIFAVQQHQRISVALSKPSPGNELREAIEFAIKALEHPSLELGKAALARLAKWRKP